MPQVRDPALVQHLESQVAPGLRGPPRLAPPQTPAGRRVEEGAAAAAPFAAPNAQANLQGQNLTNAEREANLARGGRTAAEQHTWEQERARIEAATNQYMRLARRYAEEYEPSDYLISAPDWMSGGNETFNADAENLADQAFMAFRVPGTGTSTEGDAARFARGNRLSAQSFDSTNETRLDALEGRLNVNRRMYGLEPVNWRRDTTQQVAQATAPANMVSGRGMDRSAIPDEAIQPDTGGRNVNSTEGGTYMTDADRQYAAQLTQIARRGGTDEEIRQFAASQGKPPPPAASFNILRQRRANGSLGQLSFVPVASGVSTPSWTTGFSNTFLGSYGGNSVNALLGNRLPQVSELLGGNAEQTRAGIQASRQSQPIAAILGDVTGTVGSYYGGGRAAGLLGMGGLRGAPRFIAGDAAQGAYSGSGMGDGWFDPQGAAIGAATNTGGGMAGRGLVRGVGGATRGVSNINTRFLTREGVPLTLGQIARAGGSLPGRALAGVEDRLAGIPLVGDVINSARRRGTEGFNAAAFRRGAQDVVPPGNPITATGTQGVEQGQRLVSGAYDDALSGVNINAREPQLLAELGAARGAGSRIPLQGPELTAALDHIENLVDAGGNLSGEGLQAARQIMSSGRGSAQGPLAQPLRDAYSQADNALVGAVERQSPGTVPALNAANAANRNVSILGDAVGTAKNQPGELFTPAQLGAADYRNTSNYGGRNAARAGRTPFYPLRRAGQGAMGNQIPDSGTAGRMFIGAPLLVGGGGALAGLAGDQSLEGAGGGAKDALLYGGLASLLYSRHGQTALQRALVSRGPGARALGRAIADGRIPGLNRTAPQLGGMAGNSVAGYTTYEDPESALYGYDYGIPDALERLKRGGR